MSHVESAVCGTTPIRANRDASTTNMCPASDMALGSLGSGTSNRPKSSSKTVGLAIGSMTQQAEM